MAKIKEVTGVELFIFSDNSWQIVLCSLQSSKGIITIIKKEVITSFGDLKKDVSPQIPLSISINGKGVLHKKTPVTTSGANDINTLVKSVFPAINPADFYVQTYQNQADNFLSIMRKESLDAILAQFQDAGFAILNVTFGFFALTTILPFLDLNPEAWEEFKFNGAVISINNNQIQDHIAQAVEVEWDIITLGEDQLEMKWLPAYANGICLLIAGTSGPVLDISSVINNKQDWAQRHLFKIAGWSLLLFFLFLLGANFIFYTKLSEQNKVLAQQADSQGVRLQQITGLKKEVDEKQSFLKNTGWINRSHNAYFADQLASTLPADIQLTELDINPLDQKLAKAEKKPVFQNNNMAISGKCASPQVLNSWLRKLGRLSFVKEIKEQDYSYDYTAKVGKFSFVIFLKVD